MSGWRFRADRAPGAKGWEALVRPSGGRRYEVAAGGGPVEVRLLEWEGGLLSFEVGGRVVAAAVEAEGERVDVILGGRRCTFWLGEGGRAPSREAGEEHGPLLAELPGKVIEVRVAEGDRVSPGQVLLVLEAMKMEHPLRARVAGRAGPVRVREGDQISAGQALLELLPPEGGS